MSGSPVKFKLQLMQSQSFNPKSSCLIEEKGQLALSRVELVVRNELEL